MRIVSENRSFGGRQLVVEHDSRVLGAPARFGIYLPPAAEAGAAPVVWWLSGLTCTEQNFVTKAGAQRAAARLGLAVVAPDTSPRGADVPNDEAYDLGQGASFYVDATQEPWAERFKMESYVTKELQDFVLATFAVDGERQGISGHSMGGHGALTLHFKHPALFRTVSAFSPIVAPSQVPWGRKAFAAYLGPDESAWRAHDATALVSSGRTEATILIDQGEADEFLARELQPERFETACSEAGQRLTLRRQPGYDHSYYFIATFIEDHLEHHARGLAR